MKTTPITLRNFLVVAAWVLGIVPTAAQIMPKPGNTILVYGNSFAERMQATGYFEARLQERFPDRELKVRSLAWTGDEVDYRLRPNGYANHLRDMLDTWPADIVIACFGMNESTRGESGLEAFQVGLRIYLEELKARHPEIPIVLVSPIAVEKLNDRFLPDADARNRVVGRYVAAMKKEAAKAKVRFIDLFAPTRKLYAKVRMPLTANGVHLNEAGNRQVADIIIEQMFSSAAPSTLNSVEFERLRNVVKDKAFLVAQRVRPLNGVHFYGVRARRYEYNTDMPRLNDLIANRDTRIWGLARGKEFDDPIDDSEVHPLATIKPGGRASAYADLINSPEETQKKFKIHESVEVNLFASEREFPDLVNPIQMQFDGRGRLWVACISSYPLWDPGKPPPDKIIILEDSDGDGKADKQTVFAENLNLPDGLVLTGKGAIVSLQPRLVHLIDEDGDDKADKEVELFRGFDCTDTHHGGMLNQGPDGLIYLSDGVFHRSQVETPWGVTRNRDSSTFMVDAKRHRVVVERQLGSPNPWSIANNRWGHQFQMYGGGNLAFVSAYSAWKPMRTGRSGFAGVGGGGKGCGVEILSSRHFPPKWQQAMVSNHLLGYNAVLVQPLEDAGAGYRNLGKVEILRSEDLAFRPVDTKVGLDGAIYVADFCNQVVGHAQYATRHPDRDHRHGRIWRITHKGSPLLKPPLIVDRPVPALLDLLKSPEDLVRRCVRVELSKHSDDKVLPVLKKWLAGLDAMDPEVAHHQTEALWVLQRRQQFDEDFLKRMLESPDPNARAAATRALRFWANEVQHPIALLKARLKDTSPRVRMEAVIAGTWMRSSVEKIDPLLAKIDTGRDRILSSLEKELQLFYASGDGPEVPLLRVEDNTLVKQWLCSFGKTKDGVDLTSEGDPFLLSFTGIKGVDVSKQLGEPGRYLVTLRTWIKSEVAQPMLIKMPRGVQVKRVLLNRIPVGSQGTNWGQSRQVRGELKPGMNEISMMYDNMTTKPTPTRGGRGFSVASMSVYDPSGRRLKADFPKDETALRSRANAYDSDNAVVTDDAIRIATIPHQMKFSVDRFVIQSGRKYRLTFQNTDDIIHNLVIGKVGSLNAIGAAADAMLIQPGSMEKHFVPEIPEVLWATSLVAGGKAAEITFTAPQQPGRYPFICTFPGHWRIMRGVMVVE